MQPRLEQRNIHWSKNTERMRLARLKGQPRERGALIRPSPGKHHFSWIELKLRQLDQFSFTPSVPEQTIHQEFAMCTQPVVLDSTLRSPKAVEFEEALRAKIVRQEEAVQAMVDLYQVFCAGLNSPGRPVGSLLFLGPTGSGKTRIVEAAAEVLFEDPRAVIKIDCGEFQHSHEISKLIGSPPGYLGHRETHPLITQEALAASHTDKLKLSFLLFDEIEKANDALWQLLLGMLDKATLTLGDNRRVDLSQTVIFLTSNLGSSEITELMHGGMGFIQPEDKPMTGLDLKVRRTAVEAARRNFSPEFMNRLDKIVVFHPLNREQLGEVLQIELGHLQRRILETQNGQFLLRVTDAGREFLLCEGTDKRYGARHLKRAIERHVVFPLASLLATGQVKVGDILCIDWDPRVGGLVFWKEDEGRRSTVPQPQLVSAQASKAAGAGGRAAEVTSSNKVRSVGSTR